MVCLGYVFPTLDLAKAMQALCRNVLCMSFDDRRLMDLMKKQSGGATAANVCLQLQASAVIVEVTASQSLKNLHAGRGRKSSSRILKGRRGQISEVRQVPTN